MALTYVDLDVHATMHFRPVLVNNIFVGHPLLTKMIAKQNVKIKGGKTIGQPILIGKENSGAYSGMDRFNITPVETTTIAEFEWKNRYANITIVGDDLDKTMADDDRLDLLKTRTMGAEMTLKDDLADDLFGDGTSEDSKVFDGLKNGIGTGTYGGISPSDVSVWQSVVSTTGGAVSLSRVQGWIEDTKYGQEQVDLIMCHKDLYKSLWNQVQPQQRFLSGDSLLAKVGFRGIEIDGAQVMVDRHCPSGYMYGLNTDYWHMQIHPNKNFKWTKNKEMVDADAYVRQILLKGNFFTSARRYHFKASRLTQ